MGRYENLLVSNFKKKRLDLLLVERGFADSSNKAQALILAGQVKIKEFRVESSELREKDNKQVKISQLTTHNSQLLKPGTLVFENAEIEVEPLPKFVSRGGEKLEAALEHWNVSVKDKVCLDVGSSTGGFVDCLLQSGAKKVYAVDVGHGQLHPKLRNDSRVCVYEKTHILKWNPPWVFKQSPKSNVLSPRSIALIKKDFEPRTLDIEQFPSFVTIDVSFISLMKVLPKILKFFDFPLSTFNFELEVLTLIKPQFEVGPKFIKKGIVRDDVVRESEIKKIVNECKSIGFKVLGHFPCPVLGAKGNREEWLYCKYKSPTNF